MGPGGLALNRHAVGLILFFLFSCSTGVGWFRGELLGTLGPVR